ncbi:MAG TPA: transcription-repair coupling factor [Acidiferrobacteraceae bacterium]|nr:transcription-repair coupling factor [Acidiferrobacteraceae bacterium]
MPQESRNSPLDPPLPTATDKPVTWTRLVGSSEGLALSQAAQNLPGPVVIICPDVRKLRQIESEIHFYQGDNAGMDLYLFPDWECLPYDVFSPHLDIVSERLRTLYRLPALKKGIVLVTIANLLQRVPPREYVAAHSFTVEQGAKIDIEQFRSQLQTGAYQSVSQVMGPGEYAIRGGLIDIFPMGGAHPFRIDLFDNEVESIRYFDIETQRSSNSTPKIQLLPAREFPTTETGIKLFRRNFRQRFSGDPNRSLIYKEVSKGYLPAGVENYLPLFFEECASLFEYMPPTTTLVLDDLCEESSSNFIADTHSRYEVAKLDLDRPALSPEVMFLDCQSFIKSIGSFPRIILQKLVDSSNVTDRSVFDTTLPQSIRSSANAESPYSSLLQYIQSTSNRILIVAETHGREEFLVTMLNEHDCKPVRCDNWSGFLQSNARLSITTAELELGLCLNNPSVVVITESQIFSDRVMQRRRRARTIQEPEALIRSLAELKWGDAVVHEVHGVGRYRGLQLLELKGEESEYLTLEYRDGDKLYIPILSLKLISRYTSSDPDHAPLHKLGGKEWGKLTRRAKEKVHDAAVEILEIQAVRKARKGHSFPIPDDEYASFVAQFPFEETPDQLNAIESVLCDMQSDHPMDRLVCGDVGFGKTEVALRAAFIAVQAQHQVVILVPTTLLAQQHFSTFCDRFAQFPVEIELLSRFKTAKEISNCIKNLNHGRTDIVIGTHRLLQKDVDFKQLGLVIIDEEHRFGVRQKERLKKLRGRADILTLTATPIPRTLNMALSGVRDISVIATPPQHRRSVKTFVSEWSDLNIREAFERELRRGGQIFFLHNDVKSMALMLDRLKKLIPHASIQVANGQMPEYELERVMQDFYHLRFNVLLCTTIIESGIDIPTANTIFIHRADRFGLAQLHQLRGRVGRSHHQAFAYLLIPPREALQGNALKRLEAIASLDDLGAGFILASHDLEIRGGGELLGEAQSGLIDEIGFSMYMDLLERAMHSIQLSGKQSADSLQKDRDVEVEFHTPVLLPESYIPDVHTRLVLYKRISSAKNQNELNELRVEMTDRFGLLPDPADSLMIVTTIKNQANKLGVTNIDIGPEGGVITFEKTANINTNQLVLLLEKEPDKYQMSGPTKLRIRHALQNRIKRLQFTLGLMADLRVTHK